MIRFNRLFIVVTVFFLSNYSWGLVPSNLCSVIYEYVQRKIKNQGIQYNAGNVKQNANPYPYPLPNFPNASQFYVAPHARKVIKFIEKFNTEGVSLAECSLLLAEQFTDPAWINLWQEILKRKTYKEQEQFYFDCVAAQEFTQEELNNIRNQILPMHQALSLLYKNTNEIEIIDIQLRLNYREFTTPHGTTITEEVPAIILYYRLDKSGKVESIDLNNPYDDQTNKLMPMILYQYSKKLNDALDKAKIKE